MNADLHCHSYFSDGKHSPDFLLKRAETNNISHLAITDHDFAYKPAVAAERKSDVHLISGVEISCKWQTREIHIVGIGMDPEHSVLDSLLLKQREDEMAPEWVINILFFWAYEFNPPSSPNSP